MHPLFGLIPLAVIILLFALKQHMLFAGFVGGVVAILMARLDAAAINTHFFEGINMMMTMTVPIIYASSAGMIAKAGCIRAVVNLANHYLKKQALGLVAFMVLLQAMGTLMAGLGASNSIVIAPLVFAAFGCIPEVIAGLTIATAACFSTTPASGHSAITAQFAGIDIVDYFNMMSPFVLVFVLLGIAIAVYGVKKRGAVFRLNEAAGEGEKEMDQDMSPGHLWKMSIPFIALLIMVIFGTYINKLLPFAVFVPTVSVLIACVLVVVCTGNSIKETCESLVENSKNILVIMFQVGLFLGFINIIGATGVFVALAELAGNVSPVLVVPFAVLISYLLSIGFGALSNALAALIMPTLAAIGLSPLSMGFAAIAIGFGTQLSPVQVNLAVTANAFQTKVLDVIRGNIPFNIAATVLLVIMSMIFA